MKHKLPVMLALIAGTALAEPVVLTLTFTTRDAPEVTVTDHGRPGQNARIDGCLAGPGALYLLPTRLREDDAAGPPMMAQLNLVDGKLREFYSGDPIQLKPQEAENLLDRPPGTWLWGKPLCGTVAPDGRLYLALAAKGKGGAVVVIYDPKANTFQELVTCPTNPVGLSVTGNILWLLTADGMLQVYDEVSGLEPVGRVPNSPKELQGLIADDQRNFYTAVGPAPWRVLALRMEGKTVTAAAVLTNLDSISFLGLRCEAVVARDGHFSRQCFELHAGKATAIEKLSPWKAGEYEVDTDFNTEPLAVAVRKPGQDWKRFPVVFARAAWDNIRTLSVGPDGKTLYGAGWPTAWIWRFDPHGDRFQLCGHHYEIYEMHNWKDEIWACGYWGIKLLRWRPEEPWTFDYARHYDHKTYPANSSPWGDKDISNPRLVCKFRYLKHLEVRRPAGMTITDDGCAWVGGHTPAVEYFDSRFSGAVNWYDPATETIGQIREPFIHHTVRDVCRAGTNHVAAVASQYISAFEPLPANFSPGKFVLIDTHNRSVALEDSPLNAELSYAEEGEPGHVVVYGKPGKYAGTGVAGALFLFDVAKMQVTHVIRLPVKVDWKEYDSVTRFERGPDRKIYFYGKDAQGVALCRVDSVTGVVEPVLRGHNITDVMTYNNAGAPFAFVGDRVYFGAQHLVSLPVATVTGGKP